MEELDPNWSNKPNRVPEISDERLAELLPRIKPLVRRDGKLHYIKDVDPRKVSYSWDPKLDGRAVGFEEISDITTYHNYGYHGFFKPSVAEVLSQIPADIIEDVAGFETLNGGELTGDTYHQVATTRLYRRSEAGRHADRREAVAEPLGRLSAADLARQIGQDPRQAEDVNTAREGLGQMLERCDDLYMKLESGHFESTEDGYISFQCYDSSDGDRRGIITKGAEVYFNDPTGYRTKLGRVMRTKNWHKAEARAYVTETQTEALHPGDPRWDVVVGSLGRALQQLQAKSEPDEPKAPTWL